MKILNKIQMNLISFKHGFLAGKARETFRKVQESRTICIILQSVAYLMGQTLYRNKRDTGFSYEIHTHTHTQTHTDRDTHSHTMTCTGYLYIYINNALVKCRCVYVHRNTKERK